MTHYDALGYVISSKYRRIALKQLGENPKTPKDVAEDAGFDEMTHVSRGISELRDEGLAELLVSEDTRKGRFYGLTDDGEEVLESLREREEKRGETA